jgi:hypothetical protein
MQLKGVEKSSRVAILQIHSQPPVDLKIRRFTRIFSSGSLDCATRGISNAVLRIQEPFTSIKRTSRDMKVTHSVYFSCHASSWVVICAA